MRGIPNRLPGSRISNDKIPIDAGISIGPDDHQTLFIFRVAGGKGVPLPQFPIRQAIGVIAIFRSFLN
ncbi:MAG: hypothetical protein BWY71_01845 [Planctomycetes bacterium ADurb.Bin412]|nr:MAG: hypothetical protein BWY71_01845 [Planctomycetes bacterium ADurb.Bin412]